MVSYKHRTPMAAYILHCSVEWVNQVKLIRLWLMKFVIRSVEIVGPLTHSQTPTSSSKEPSSD